MKTKPEDRAADIQDVLDRRESVSQMEPLLLGESSRNRAELTDLVVDLVSKAGGFRRSLPLGIVTALADLVRAMNCYYSNLIEGQAFSKRWSFAENCRVAMGRDFSDSCRAMLVGSSSRW